MSYFKWNICIYVALIIMAINGIARGRSSHRHRPRHQHTPSLTSNIHTVVVDTSGQGDFSNIQSAIDSVPSNNPNWICINIKAGTYNEQVMIPVDKPMIYLKGEGAETTNVVWDNADIESPTFLIHADNIVARDLSFTNSHNYPPDQTQNRMEPATAAMINGDKNSFYNCGFYGFQDTLWDEKGRHYFKGCTITGAVDFIMGAGQSIYEECTISVNSKVLGGQPGFITANSRGDPDNDSGFVFTNTEVMGDGQTYLGRPWRPYARVLFHECNMSSIVVPEGWDSWYSNGREDLLTLAENDCNGPGSDTSKRVKWETKLSEQTLQSLTSMSFIDNEGWISQQAFD